MKVNDMRRLEMAQNTMLRWMCGLILRDKKPTAELLDCLGVVTRERGLGSNPWTT